MDIPVFIPEDGDAIIAELKADMEARLGKTIAPADTAMLQINSRAYYRLLFISAINDVARQNLVAFARGNMLDYLGELVGVVRLPSAQAICTIEFTLVDTHDEIVIPSGTRIQSTDQKVIFTTNFDLTVDADATTASVAATCVSYGTIGNDYAIGAISIILDPQPFVVSVANSDITNSGTDDETDDNLRTRIKLAPNSYSVAGPKDAYKFFAKSAHPDIVDVAIMNDMDGDTPIPGTVNIYPLLNGGVIPSSDLLAIVQAACNNEKVRPLTDIVTTLAPTKHEYTIAVNITLFPNAARDVVMAQIQKNLDAYVAAGLNMLGRNIVVSQIAGWCMIEGQVYDVEVVSPSANYTAAENVFTKCTSALPTYVGTNE